MPQKDAGDGSAALTAHKLRVVRVCLGILAVLATGSLVGVAFSLYLVNHYPLVLIALSPLGRHLVLVAPIVAPTAFLTVAFARRMSFYLTLFYLGVPPARLKRFYKDCFRTSPQAGAADRPGARDRAGNTRNTPAP